jgi:ribosomal protein S7
VQQQLGRRKIINKTIIININSNERSKSTRKIPAAATRSSVTLVVTEFVNNMMYEGEKAVAYKVYSRCRST